MIRNYLKIAVRSLMRSKIHSAINIAGLSIGICCCVLIGLFVKEELTFDRFHENAESIYRVYAIEDWGENQRFIDITTPFPMGPALKENLQEVESMVRIHDIGSQVKTASDLFSEQVTIAGVEFLEMFDFELVKGRRDGILSRQSSVILTEETANRFFGNTDPVGKTLSLYLSDRFEDFTVTGVLKNPPTNSSIQFQIIISDLNYPKLYSQNVLTSQWFNITPETYIQLREGVTAESVSSKFPAIFKPLLGDNYEKSKYFVGLQPLTAIHLDTSLPAGLARVSDPRYTYILSAVALLILLVACINFITLSVGRSIKRSKEVGIRKVSGAQRTQLILQFIGEAVITTAIALLMGLALAGFCLPLFNDLSGKQLVLNFDGYLLAMCLSLIGVIGCFAGSYPALILSAFKPVAVLKGTVKAAGNKQTLRKILVGVQLVLSIFLISSTLLMKKQLQFLQTKNLGFDKEQLAVIQLNVNPGRSLMERVSEGFRLAENFKAELSKIPRISSVCASSHYFANGNWVSLGFTDDAGVYRTFSYNTIDEDYIESMRMEIIFGRNLDQENPADRRRSLIVNEAFVKYFGWTDGVGKRIPGKNFEDHEIIGVVRDFNYSSLYTKVGPLVMAMNPAMLIPGTENINIENSPIPKLLIRIRPGNASKTLSEIKAVWDRLTGEEEFSFAFVDETVAGQYRSDQNLGKIITVATFLALIIGSMGLYGLASLAMQNRTKEISIRKVLGATRSSILVLLSKDFILLILISLILSVPLTWYLMKDWLMNFEYRINIGADVFFIAGGISLVIAALTIGYEVLKSAARQPAETLKYE